VSLLWGRLLPVAQPADHAPDGPGLGIAWS
jgi:hypothetical protein